MRRPSGESAGTAEPDEAAARGAHRGPGEFGETAAHSARSAARETAGAADTVAAELADHLERAGLADPWSDVPGQTTRTIFSSDGDLYEPQRLRLHDTLIDEALADMQAEHQGSLTAVVTAGPPGAGKSTAIAGLTQLADYRHVDADAFKDALLLESLEAHRIDGWLTRRLADGHPVSVRELSAFVHAESTAVANRMRRRCLQQRENVVIHGTLSSTEHLEALLADLDEHGYDELLIVCAEVPCEVAVQRSTDRWWADRSAYRDGFGGRFVPAAIIRDLYPDAEDGRSRCVGNADDLRQRATALGWSVSVVAS